MLLWNFCNGWSTFVGMEGSMKISRDSNRVTPYAMSGFDEAGNFSVLLTFELPNTTCDDGSMDFVKKLRFFIRIHIRELKNPLQWDILHACTCTCTVHVLYTHVCMYTNCAIMFVHCTVHALYVCTVCTCTVLHVHYGWPLEVTETPKSLSKHQIVTKRSTKFFQVVETENKRDWRTIDGNPPSADPSCEFTNESCAQKTTSKMSVEAR